MKLKKTTARQSVPITPEQKDLCQKCADEKDIFVSEVYRNGALMYVEKNSPELFNGYKGE